MNGRTPDLSTDAAWEEWGRRDPYFGVITDTKFRREEMTEQARREFFESGRWHVEYVLQMIRRHIDPNFTPKAVLDFGCGVGRTLIPFAAVADEVVGLDVSSTMLQEAQRNCDERQLPNVLLIRSDDFLSSLPGTFDLVHSYITFQHIPPERGRTIYRNLLAHLAPGGIAAIHFSYAKNRYASALGLPPRTDDFPTTRSASGPPSTDPEMQMNTYNMNELLFLTQQIRVQRIHTEFTDHGGELGTFLFFQRPD